MKPSTPHRHFICTQACAISIFFAALLLLSAPATAQTIVANRVKAAAASLPKGSRIVAKYTDNKRHSLYYIANDRLYKYDVLTNTNSDVRFTTSPYSHIVNTYVTEHGRYIFVCVDKNGSGKADRKNSQELWRITPDENTCKMIGRGFAVQKVNDIFVIKVFVERKATASGDENSRWTVRERHFYLDGQSRWMEEGQTLSE